MCKFELGQTVTTRGVAGKIENDPKFEIFIRESFKAYAVGDWGMLDEEDKQSNDEALKNGGMILAAYIYPVDGTKIWIITEWDRSATTILFPEEY